MQPSATCIWNGQYSPAFGLGLARGYVMVIGSLDSLSGIRRIRELCIYVLGTCIVSIDVGA
jgi:hypothetical protein